MADKISPVSILEQAQDGNLQKLKALAKSSPTALDAVDIEGMTALHFAARAERLNVVEWLLSDEGRAAGFNRVLSRAIVGNLTALHFAVHNCDLDCLKTIVYGCKVENGERKELLNAVDSEGHTVFHYAAIKRNLAIIKWLLSDKKGGGREAGFDSVLAKDKEEMTALYGPAQEGDLECFVAMVEGCKVDNGERKKLLNAVTDEGLTVLHQAAFNGRPSIIKWLLSKGRDYGFTSILAETDKGVTALPAAAVGGDLETCKAIVEGCEGHGELEEMLRGANNAGLTVLHIAVQRGHLQLVKWLLPKYAEYFGIASILIEEDDMSALHIAAEEGHLEICKAIVNACNVRNFERQEILNGIDLDGYTALHHAAENGHTSVVSWLLSDKPGGGRTMGFKIVLEEDDLTALHIAVQAGHLETCKAIVYGCKIKNGEKKKMLNAVDMQGYTVLHYAVLNSQFDIVSWLLSNKPDGGRANGLKTETITAETMYMQSALHLAAESGSPETVRALLSGCTVGERLKLFLTVDIKGWTPLHHAARFGEVDAIRELLLHREETKMIVDHRDRRGMTALHRTILDGGVDEESKREWKDDVDTEDEDLPPPPREEVVAALLTYEIDDDDEEEEEKGQATSETKKSNKKQQQQQQQAAFIDVNLGLKIEKKENEI